MAGPHSMLSLLVLVAATLAVATTGNDEMAFVLADTPFVLDVVPLHEVETVVLLDRTNVLRLVVTESGLADMITAWSVEVFSLARSLSRPVVVILGRVVDHGRLRVKSSKCWGKLKHATRRIDQDQ